MKTPNLLLSGALALVSAASAGAAPITVPAANVLHVVGSTAYRAPFTQSLIDLLSGSNGYGYTYYNPSSASATSVYKASQAVFVGTLNGNPVAIETFWTGSLAGSVDVSVQNKLQGDFLSSTNTLTNAQITTGTPVFDNGTDGSGAAPQVAMSDSFQTSVEPSVFTAPVNGPTFSQAIKSANLVDGGSTAKAAGTVGIVPFEWVTGALASGATPGGFTNISQQAALALLTSPISVSLLTGNATDASKYILLVGRNEDSGTRIAGLAEPQYGFGQPPIQYAYTFSNNQNTQTDGRQTGGITTAGTPAAETAVATLTGGDEWPASAPVNTEPSLNWQTSGHSGYIAGGDVANVLLTLNPTTASSLTIGSFTPTVTPTNYYLVGYLGVADGYSITNPSATGVTAGVALSYNGVPYSVGAVENGAYTFWSYEHLYYQGIHGGTPLAGEQLTIANAIAQQIFTTDADINSSGAHGAGNAAGIFYSAMKVNRSVEGGQISGN